MQIFQIKKELIKYLGIPEKILKIIFVNNYESINYCSR